MAFEKLRATARDRKDRNAYNAFCGKFFMKEGRIRCGFKSWAVQDCTVELHDNGTLSSQPADGVIRVGGVPSINTTGWLIVHTPDGEKRARIIGDEIGRARTFEMNFNLERERLQSQA